MSVDMTVFEEFKEALGEQGNIKDFIYNLANGDIGLHFDKCSSPPPFRGNRKYNDPEYIAEYDQWFKIYDAENSVILDKFGYEHISQDGGGEGEGEDCDGVFKLGNKFYSTSWNYYSHLGCEYDDIVENLMEVKPEQRTVTVYVRA